MFLFCLFLCKWVISILVVTLNFPLRGKKETSMTSFALALIIDSLQSYGFSKSTYTNLKAEWLSATDGTHTSTRVRKCTICSFWFVHQLNREHSHRAICFLSVHRNANLSIYPALPASPLRSLCWQPVLLLVPLFFTLFPVNLCAYDQNHSPDGVIKFHTPTQSWAPLHPISASVPAAASMHCGNTCACIDNMTAPAADVAVHALRGASLHAGTELVGQI